MNTTQTKAVDKRKRSNLRLPPEIEDLVDQARRRRPGNISRNTWIIEAIQEKLERGGDNNGG